MTEKKVQNNESAALRHRAELLLREKAGAKLPFETGDEPARLHHELQVHQIELEMQNAQLRQARYELEAALEKYTDLYDFAPVGYCTLDRMGTIRGVNLTGAGLLGIERSRLIGRRFDHFIPVDTRSVFSVFLEKIFTCPTKEACEVILLQEGKVPLSVQVEGVAAESGLECRLALIDITERKQGEEALRREKDAANALRLEKAIAELTAQAKSQFLVNMSHELRTPMTGILGMLQFALEEDLAPATRESLEKALSSARSLLRTLNDILDMAMFEVGKFAIDEKPFSPWRCIAEAVDAITPEARRKGLDLTMSVAAEVPETLIGDQLRLQQVLVNLIGNAVKFTDAGKVEVRVTAGRETSDRKGEFTFVVTDTGIGIPDDKKELLFRAFSQVDASHSRRFGGTGLGLAICREIVALMGGTISFESAEGVGSTFSFTIPLREAGLECDALSAAVPRSLEAAIAAPPVAKYRHILLAEDDPTIREILGRMLKREYYDVDIAEDGLQVIAMWEKGDYDLVLMDVQMPRLDGLDATRAIREKERERGGHTPIVAMTAHARKEDEESCLSAGMDAHISKPIDFQKSLQVIRDILNRKSSSVC